MGGLLKKEKIFGEKNHVVVRGLRKTKCKFPAEREGNMEGYRSNERPLRIYLSLRTPEGITDRDVGSHTYQGRDNREVSTTNKRGVPISRNP